MATECISILGKERTHRLCCLFTFDSQIHERFQRTLLIRTKHSVNIVGGGNPIYKANKTTLKQQLNDEKEKKKEEKKKKKKKKEKKKEEEKREKKDPPKKKKSEMESQDTYLFWVELCCFRLTSSHF